MAGFTVWDWFVIATLLLSVAFGLVRGMVRTLFALAAWVVGLVGAPLLAGPLAHRAGVDAHPLLVMAMLFVVLFLATRLLGALIAGLLSKVGLGGVDRLLGAVLGAARAVAVVALAAVLARTWNLDQDRSWREAKSRPLLDAIVRQAEPWLPERRRGVRYT